MAAFLGLLSKKFGRDTRVRVRQLRPNFCELEAEVTRQRHDQNDQDE
jgi:hypothetical protein